MEQRIDLEIKTLDVMFNMYCKLNHHFGKNKNSSLCEYCQELFDYSISKVSNCKLKKEGQKCSKCKIHCFKDCYRAGIQKVMRFSGPRLIFTNPILALKHIF